jgi:hypothetical protein
MLLLIPCPECDAPAEITDRFRLPSTDGPVELIVVQCVAGHYFRMAADRLASCAMVSDEPVHAGAPRPGTPISVPIHGRDEQHWD